MRPRKLRRQAPRIARLAPTVLSAALVAATLAPESTLADFTPASLVSGSSTIQADYAYSPAISANGEYVAFVGSVASVKGVYVKDLSDDALKLVALGNASAPSISEDGRYVSFTTSEDPITGTATADECSSVYVRDMNVPLPEALEGEPGPSKEGTSPFTLVSARNGTEEPLAYAGTGKPGCPGGGSAAADRVAMSANGEKVVFTVIGQSDLTQGQPGTPETPPDQIAVRNLLTQTTTLVSTTLASQQTGIPRAVPLGAALAGNQTPIQEDPAHNPVSASTAAISADGGTVAWMGINITEQAPVGPPGPGAEVKYGYVGESEVKYYAEPLWRRIEEGPTAPTRRILGEDDPSDPGFAGPLNLSWDPMDVQGTNLVSLYGSYVVPDGFEQTGSYQDAAQQPAFSSITPQLSRNGLMVALLSTAPPDGGEPTYPMSAPATVPSNIFLVNMSPGLSRAEAVRAITAWGATDFGSDLAATAPIGDLAISPDGTRVAFTTIRTLFPLAPPELVTPQVTTTSFPQLYEADMRSDTLSLVSEGYDGSAAAGSVYTPSFDRDGNKLAFASSAPNLVYGASNPGHSDVFTISAVVTSQATITQSITPLPPAPSPSPQWRLSATVRQGPGGSLLLDVVVPGAGSLSALASTEATLTTVTSGKPHRRDGHAAHTATSTATRDSSAAVKIADARMATKGAGLVELRLRLSGGRFQALSRRRGGLYANVTVSFLAPHRPRLTETLKASFHDAKTTRHAGRGPAARRAKHSHDRQSR
jgi:Tol biopolymer transport system component